MGIDQICLMIWILVIQIPVTQILIVSLMTKICQVNAVHLERTSQIFGTDLHMSDSNDHEFESDITNDWIITDMTNSKHAGETSDFNPFMTSDQTLLEFSSTHEKTRHHRFSTAHRNRHRTTEDATISRHTDISHKDNTISQAHNTENAELATSIDEIVNEDSTVEQTRNTEYADHSTSVDETVNGKNTVEQTRNTEYAEPATSVDDFSRSDPKDVNLTGTTDVKFDKHTRHKIDHVTSLSTQQKLMHDNFSLKAGSQVRQTDNSIYITTIDQSGNKVKLNTTDHSVNTGKDSITSGHSIGTAKDNVEADFEQSITTDQRPDTKTLSRSVRRYERLTASDTKYIDPMTSAYTAHDETISLSIYPTVMHDVLEDSYKQVSINCTIANARVASQERTHLDIYVTVRSEQTRVLIPYPMTVKNSSIIPLQLDKSGVLTFPLDCSRNPNLFGVHTNTVGRSRLAFQIMRSTSSENKTIYSKKMDISVVRKIRFADIVFDCVMPVIMLVVTFSVGCLTDIKELREHVKKPLPVLIGLACQFILLPLITIAAAKIVLNEPDMGLGLLFVATAPGGGGGHLMVAIAGGDIPLSVLLNFTALTCTLVFCPLWLLAVGTFLKSEYTSVAYGNIILWICLAIAIYFLGICLRKRSAPIADAILNWLTKPLLLLIGILYITLGLYTNTYMFMVFDSRSLLLVLLYSSVAYCLGFFLPLILRQPFEYSKTIASHTAIPHCLLSLVLVRYSLNQPASDIASISPIILVIFSYVPFIIEFLYKIARDFVRERLEKLEEEKERLSRTGTQASLVNLNTNNHAPLESSTKTSVISQIMPVDNYKSMSVHEQVTVL